MDKYKNNILEKIIETNSLSENPKQSLDQIVRIIAENFNIDVCSVYLYNPYNNNLVLKSTIGLRKESVGLIEMDVNEGLTGMVIETMAPVFIVNPSSHSRFKYYAESGEEIYKTYLGVPLIYYKKILGALVVQTKEENGIDKSDINVFRNIANQIASTIAIIMIQENNQNNDLITQIDKNNNDEIQKKFVKSKYLSGVPISDQVAFGYAHFIIEKIDFDQINRIHIDDIESEIKRLLNAFKQAKNQIKENMAKHSGGLLDYDKSIIEVHLMILDDKKLHDKIINEIQKYSNAEYALKKVIFEYTKVFKSMNDPYLIERSADIIDIGRRVLSSLVGVNEDLDQAFTTETIIVASDLSPVDLMTLRQPNLKGIVLAKGGKTSHTVIMAKSLEIPIIIGVEGLLDYVRTNDYLIIDGASGNVFTNPDSEILKVYERRNELNKQEYKKLESLRNLPAITKDGIKIKLGANIGLLSDVMLSNQYGADNIGLYRTEFPFLLRNSFPSEEEQFSLYMKVLEKANGKTVTIRTFDVGGDKFLPYLDYPKEDNPFLGWRSIRLSLDLENIFRTQLKAILRVSAFYKVKILFPMISNVDELISIKNLIISETHSLIKNGIKYEPNIELGIMVEVPGAVPILDRLLKYVDFINIGTNDLIQYLLAVDRNNKKVAKHFNVLHPSVIETIYNIVSICKQFEKKVCICGEAASIKESIFLFIGMGASHISMVPSNIPIIKGFIRSINQSDAQDTLKECLKMESAKEIEKLIINKLERVNSYKIP